MNEIIQHKADNIRDVIHYLKRFKNALLIIYIDDILIDSPAFGNHVKDICRIHESGLKIILVPGASKRINQILTDSNISWSYKNGSRITSESAMPLIKMAAFDVSNQIMTALAGEHKSAVIGNWVRARSKGVIDGFDFGTSGEIDKLEIDSIRSILDNGFIPIFPCIGWSLTGKPYNISSVELSQQIAIHLKADKLFYLTADSIINKSFFKIPEVIGTSPDGTVPAMNLEEVDLFLKENVSCETQNEKIKQLLELAKDACLNEVKRVHILNGQEEGTILCEIFSNLGSGTMIYSSNYGKIRNMNLDDISSVLSLMAPFIEKKILLPRNKEYFIEQYQNYIVYEIDGNIKACASLIPYADGQMEIAGVTVDSSCSNLGIGPKLIKELISRAKNLGCNRIFLLTTQTSDWFEKLGFIPGTTEALPEERKKIWTPERNSRVMYYNK